MLFYRSQQLASRLPALLLDVERVAQSVYQGFHGRRQAGVGDTFWQYRPYTSGDAAARIDWRQSARTDKTFIREREWEAAQLAVLWADRSGSMNFSSATHIPTKASCAELLLLALASLLLRGNEKVRWLSRHSSLTVQGAAGLQRIVARLSPLESSVSMPPSMSLPRNAHIALCSDFLMSATDLQELMRTYTSLNAKGVLVHVLDPMELDFTFVGCLNIQGCEGEEPLLLPNARHLRETYVARMQHHISHLRQIADAVGWSYIQHQSGHAPETTLRRLYQALSAPKGNS